ncbi:MAG: trimethylamine methyltransferase family protein [Pseudomonadota bacterium]
MSRRQSPRNRKRNPAEGALKQSPFRAVQNPYPPFEILSKDHIENLHQASLEVLRDVGMKVTDGRALDLLKAAGATVDRSTEIVKFDPAFVEEMIADIPSEFTVHARNPEKTLTIGGNKMVFATVCGPPFVSDLDRGRREGTIEDTRNMVRLVHSVNIYHHDGGAGVEPLDLPANSRHLDMMYAQITLTDKGWQPTWLNSRKRARDCIEMAKIALGVSDKELAERPAFATGINTNSPLVLDGAMADGLIEMALAGQPVNVTPFTLAGAMSPATMLGSVVQQNAEALAGMVVAQAARRGCPVFYGHFTSNVDMRTGSPAFGTPEYAKSVVISGQLARRYGVPIRSSNATASTSVDAQASYESSMSCWSCILSHMNVMLHAGGWLEGGLVCSYEKMILDAEILQMLAAFLEPVTVNRDQLGLEAIEEVRQGGHFFGAAHTLARYQDAFYEPLLSDWRNFESWHEDGAKSATQRANEIWKQLLKDYEQPPLDPAIDEALQAYVAKRKEEIALTGD